MAREFLTDMEVEEEIARLRASDEVKLARFEQQVRNRRRQAMYQLRWLERRGKELIRSGLTMERLRQLDSEVESDIDDGDNNEI